jgi:phospholipase C
MSSLASGAIMGTKNIAHVVFDMTENRSFDNLLGWLYDDLNNQPSYNIPDPTPTVFEGLRTGVFSNQLGDTSV